VQLFDLSGKILCDLIWLGVGTGHYYYWYAFALKSFCQCSISACVRYQYRIKATRFLRNRKVQHMPAATPNIVLIGNLTGGNDHMGYSQLGLPGASGGAGGGKNNDTTMRQTRPFTGCR
jgi:hypothetical protein